MTVDLIAVRLPPGEAFVSALDRIWAAGDAILPLPWRAPDRVVQEIVRTLSPTALLQPGGDGKLVKQRLPHGAAAPQGTALVVVTSGSTGAPKGVELSHAALTASTRASVRRLGCERGEVWLGCLPVAHVAGFQTILRSRSAGVDPVLHERFDPRAIARETRVSWISLVPTQLSRLLEAGTDLARFRGILLGGARAPRSLLERAEEVGARVTVSYGMTETCGGCVYDGVPLDGVEVESLHDGRLRIRGPVLARGYRGDSTATRRAFRDGWFLTNDLGRVVDGKVEVFGRADDVIVTGGEKVVAGRVAEALRALSDVADAAVVGRPDEEWGELVVAIVVPADPDDPPSLDELREVLGQDLPPAALPRALGIVDDLPRDELGKLSRSDLGGLAAEADTGR